MREAGDAQPPLPASSESFNSGYAYRSVFRDLRQVYGSEGGVAYAADREDGFYVIVDESFWAGFAEDLEPLITIGRFDTAEARDAYCRARFQRLRKADVLPRPDRPL